MRTAQTPVAPAAISRICGYGIGHVMFMFGATWR